MCESLFPTKSEPTCLKGFWIPALVFLVLSCRTLPEITYSSIADSLPTESNFIMKIAVPGNESLVNTLMLQFGIDPRNLSDASERMEHLTIGLEIDSSTEGKRTKRVPFHIVAIGNWPKALFGEVLGEEWVKTGCNRWFGPAGLQLMVISRRELIISSGKLDSMLVRLSTASKNMEIASVGITTEGTDLAFWLSDPDLIHSFLPTVPVRNFAGDVIVDLVGGAFSKVGDDAYSLDMSIQPLNPQFAKSLALAMRLSLASRIGEASGFPEFLAGLDIEARESEVIINHPSIPVDLLEIFLSFDFALEVTGFDSSN
ncbi:hypothetical protein [Olavius algarvensis spirochete endosymbiont]|uniref:hypothetical protein n=1 Tax=Olavius algarvensis spirochete endosymbiont TaxID=260710 RepID=UPI000F51A487|nr:hypothetical protein [Olavius algarvensis spirochete endosymbiont]